MVVIRFPIKPKRGACVAPARYPNLARASRPANGGLVLGKGVSDQSDAINTGPLRIRNSRLSDVSAYDLPLNFHPAGTGALWVDTPVGAGGATDIRAELSDGVST